MLLNFLSFCTFSESLVDEVSSAIEPILIAVANYEKDM